MIEKIECSKSMQINFFKICNLELNLKSYNTVSESKILIYDYKVKK